MIVVTRRTRERLFLNEDLIETIEANPDTVMTLIGGQRIIVVETPEEILDRIVECRRAVGRGVGSRAAAGAHAALVPVSDAGAER